MADRRSWERDDFADHAEWFAQWLADGRPCSCFVNRGELGLLVSVELGPARAWVQRTSRTATESPEPSRLFVEWTGGPEVVIERKHFRRAVTDDDALVVVELFSRPPIIMRFYRR